MSIASALINKLNRRAKYIKRLVRSYDKVHKQEEAMRMPVKKLVIDIDRHFDRSLTTEIMSQKVAAAQDLIVAAVDRHVFGVTPGIRLSLPSAFASYKVIAIGDLIEFKKGQLAGRMLRVVNIASLVVQLEDFASFSGTETNAPIRLLPHAVKSSYV